MAIIFPDEINNQKDDDLRKRIDTLYDYVDYMKEMLEFWGKNRTSEISSADKGIAVLNEETTDLEQRIAAYEDAIEIGAGETGITAHKPMTLEDSFNFATQGALQTASWTATSTNGALQNLTQPLTLCKGVWVIMAQSPTVSANQAFTFRTTSGTTDLNAQNYFTANASISATSIQIVTVTSSTATIVLQTGNSVATTYSQTERGWMKAIRVR